MTSICLWIYIPRYTRYEKLSMIHFRWYKREIGSLGAKDPQIRLSMTVISCHGHFSMPLCYIQLYIPHSFPYPIPIQTTSKGGPMARRHVAGPGGATINDIRQKAGSRSAQESPKSHG